MKRGNTEKETLDLNGWAVGSVLESDDGFGPYRIRITAIGEERFLCRWDHRCTGEYGGEAANTVLHDREWRKIN